jgi:hypothetical protein
MKVMGNDENLKSLAFKSLMDSSWSLGLLGALDGKHLLRDLLPSLTPLRSWHLSDENK